MEMLVGCRKFTTDVDIEVKQEGGGIHNKDPSWHLNDDARLPYHQPRPFSTFRLA